MQKVVFRKCYTDNVKIHPHCNTKYCSQKILEINPARSCELHCQYCCVYKQESNCNEFKSMVIYEDYPEMLERYIIDNKNSLANKMFFFSFETDCLTPALQNSGITERILSILGKYEQRYFLLTKGVIKNDNIKQILLKTSKFAQVIVNDTMPNNSIREILEPDSATIEERQNLVKFCLNNNIPVTVSFSPILPFCGINYLCNKIKMYTAYGVKHFRLDMLELSLESLEYLKSILPQYNDKLEELYQNNNSIKRLWTSPKNNHKLERIKPSSDYMTTMYNELKKFVSDLPETVTVSICDGVVATVPGLRDFNKEAYKHGYNCMGVKF